MVCGFSGLFAEWKDPGASLGGNMESRVQDFSEVNPKKVSTISLSLYHLYMSIIYMYISSLSSLSIYIYIICIMSFQKNWYHDSFGFDPGLETRIAKGVSFQS